MNNVKPSLENPIEEYFGKGFGFQSISWITFREKRALDSGFNKKCQDSMKSFAEELSTELVGKRVFFCEKDGLCSPTDRGENFTPAIVTEVRCLDKDITIYGETGVSNKSEIVMMIPGVSDQYKSYLIGDRNVAEPVSEDEIVDRWISHIKDGLPIVER